MKTWCAYVLAAAALLSVPAVVAQAQTPNKAQQDAIRSNCRSDFMRNCSSVPRGGREALECLMQNKAKVSAGCQGALNAVAAPAPAAAKPEPKAETQAAPRTEPAPAAAAPVQNAPQATPRSAPHSAPPPPQVPSAAAPAEPRAKPKPAPKAVATPTRPAPPVAPQAAAPAMVPAAPPPATAQQPRLGEAILIRRFCTTDFRVLCKGVPLGQGRAIQCLANNGPALSPGCREAMTQTGELR